MGLLEFIYRYLKGEEFDVELDLRPEDFVAIVVLSIGLIFSIIWLFLI